MNKLVIVGLLILGLGGVTACSVVSYGIKQNNEWAEAEAGIKAQYSQNKNNYSAMFTKIVETAQVPQQYAEDLKKVFDGAMTGRYGAEGSKAIFQMLTEQNPNLDASLYKQIQQVIESSRTSFEADQKMLIDKKLQYEKSLVVFPNSLLKNFLGFPKIDLKEYDIVVATEADEAFKTKKADAIDVFQKKKTK